MLKVESESGRVLLGMKRSLLENKEYNTAEATKEDILFMEDEAEDGEDESEDVLETGTRDYDQVCVFRESFNSGTGVTVAYGANASSFWNLASVCQKRT